jgi:hypothetical protein
MRRGESVRHAGIVAPTIVQCKGDGSSVRRQG